MLSLPERGSTVAAVVVELWDDLQIVDDAADLRVLKRKPKVADRLAPFSDEEVLGAAEHSLWVSTYAFFHGPRAFETLARRMDQVPDLRVTLLLNVERKRGDTSAAEQLVRCFADRFWNTEWPGAARPRVFFDARALEPEAPGGVLHAKAVVADDEAVFVTSANLAEAALERNIEPGLVVRDRALAGSIVAHFRGLIDRGLLSALPAE